MRPLLLTILVPIWFLLGTSVLRADPITLDSTVTPVNGYYRYDYSLRNQTDTELEQQVTEFLLPLFRIADVMPGSISSPAGWSFEFLTGSAIAASAWSEYVEAIFGSAYLPFQFTNPPVVLRWLAEPGQGLFPDAIGEFSFWSQYPEVNAPFVAQLREPDLVFVGDPPIPYSGNVQALMPEPGILTLWGLALLGLAQLSRIRRGCTA